MRMTEWNDFRRRLLAWMLVVLLCGAGEVLHLSLTHHSLHHDGSGDTTCVVCKLSEHAVGNLAAGSPTGAAPDIRVFVLELPVYDGFVSPAFPHASPRAPPALG